MTPPATGHRTRGLAVFVAIGGILWRLLSVPPGLLWRDWVLLLTVYATYSLFCRTSRHWSAASAGVMAFLLGIYVEGQLPHVLAVLGMRP